MENKLSREDVVRVFFQYCPGAKVGITAEQFKHPVEVIGIEIMDIEQGVAVLKVIDNGIRRTYCINIEDVKLCLTPLSEISDEDALDIGKIVAGRPNDNVSDALRPYIIYLGRGVIQFHFLNITPWGDGQPYDHTGSRRAISDFKPWNNTFLIDYLRSKSYHLPYKGIDLFEAGIAIKP